METDSKEGRMPIGFNVLNLNTLKNTVRYDYMGNNCHKGGFTIVMHHSKKNGLTCNNLTENEKQTESPPLCKIKRAANPLNMLTHFTAHLILPRHTFFINKFLIMGGN